MADFSKGPSTAENDSEFVSSLQCSNSHAAFCQGDGAEEQDFGKDRCIWFLIQKFIYISP